MKDIFRLCLILPICISTISCIKDYSCGTRPKAPETWSVRNELDKPIRIKAYGIGGVDHHNEFSFEVLSSQLYSLGNCSLASSDSLDVMFNNGKITRLYTYTAPTEIYHLNKWCRIEKDDNNGSHYCLIINNSLELISK